MKNGSVAVFIDLENIHYSTLNNYAETPDWSHLVSLCKGYGRIASIQAFGDWVNFSKEVNDIQKNGIQPVYVPLSQDGKSSLDCYLTVSAMKLFFQNNTVNTMILASGDRDYIPLIAELKALGKNVVLLAVPHTLSKDLTTIVDDVIVYEPKTEERENQTKVDSSHEKAGYDFVVETLRMLEESSIDNRWVNLSAVGLGLKKNDPLFTHKAFGYMKLVDMLDAIPEIEIKYDGYEKKIALARTNSSSVSREQKSSLVGTVAAIKDGYGFITPYNSSGSVFFHYSKVIVGSINDLIVGDKVTYDVYTTDRGENAENVCKQSIA